MRALQIFAVGLFSLGILSGIFAPGIAQYYGQIEKDAITLRQEQQGGPENVMIILDASASMQEPLGGVTKIQAAKDVILNTVRSLPPNINVGLRVYGHKRAHLGAGFSFGNPFFGPGNQFSTGGYDCNQTEVLVPIGQNNRLTIASKLTNIQPTGKTPITFALRESVMNDFRYSPGKKTIILVSDGRETCSYNPCDLALEMVRNGVDVKINTIGYGIRDQVATDQLKCVAMSTKGKFYSANTAADLARSLQDSMQVTTSVKAKITPGP